MSFWHLLCFVLAIDVFFHMKCKCLFTQPHNPTAGYLGTSIFIPILICMKSIGQMLFFFLKSFIYLREGENAREWAWWGEQQSEREKQAPRWAGRPSQCSMPGLCNHDLSQRQMLNWAIQASICIINIILKLLLSELISLQCDYLLKYGQSYFRPRITYFRQRFNYFKRI